MDITGSSYITVRNWEKFQHYSDRRPIWIKLYTHLLQDPNYLDLSLASRGLLATIWLARAASGGAFSVASLRTASRQPVYSTQLLSLSDAGFIELSASKPLATKKEVEVEKESPYPLKVAKANRRDRLHTELLNKARHVASSWATSNSEAFDFELDRLEREHECELSYTERQALWDKVIKR